MKIIVHRGTHQIGGVATEIATDKTRIIIDMGDELSLDSDFVPEDLQISGVTDYNGKCDAILFTHNHGDHVGQIKNIRSEISLYMGELAKEILLKTIYKPEEETISKIKNANVFEVGKKFQVGDIFITPFSIDHSAVDSYMFLIEADGKKILHTGDFRLHGFRGGKVMPKILDAYVKNIDVLIIEGTTLSGGKHESIKEVELEQKLKEYIKAYKYVFVYCSSTNLERICAFSKSVPRGKYFLCDARQYILLDTIEKYWGKYSELYRNLKKTIYKEEKIENYKKRGFVMMVRDNQNFRKIIPNFEKEKSIMLYSMWDGYRTKENSTIPEFLELAGKWEHLHTSGHASISDIKKVIDKVKPKYIVTMHTEKPEALKEILKESELESAIVNLNDKEVFEIK